MNFVLPLERMTKAEKLAAMEVLWTDLSREEGQFESPAWHKEVLDQREAAMKEGREVPVDWETAKRRLRELGQ